MFGFRYARSDLHAELLPRATADGIAFVVDGAGFIVVDSKAEHLRLGAIRNDIDERSFGDTVSHSYGLAIRHDPALGQHWEPTTTYKKG